MNHSGEKKRYMAFVRLLLPGLIGWALCGVTIAIGRRVTSMRNTLIGHAIATPIIFAGASFVYFSRVHETTPLQTAIVYLLLVLALDFVIVATFVEKSYRMFASVLGTWLPFALIFASTYLVGWYMTR